QYIYNYIILKPKENYKMSDQKTEMSSDEFCDTRQIRERDKIVARMMHKDKMLTEKEWEKLLSDNKIVDFSNPTSFKNEDAVRVSLEDKKPKDEKTIVEDKTTDVSDKENKDEKTEVDGDKQKNENKDDKNNEKKEVKK